MSKRFDQLFSRHRDLRARCDQQRQQMYEIGQQIEQQLAGVDRTVDKLRALARSPWLAVGGVAVIALIGPRRLMRLAGRSALLYSTAGRFLRRREG